ncbi:MAG: fdrA domain protein [Rhodospirillaceae bacterium]|nr:fdrA domain protein [Rhodospirillaceae bacterium]|tara:strand:- start:280 stop:459 length:180 start_codon:yes stop_codon:yes gene_type:complete
MKHKEPTELLLDSLKIVNIGLESFSQDLQKQDVSVIHVDWSPPAGGNVELANLLSKLGS